MRTIAVTGSASGIGAAIRARLEREGARVIGVGLRDAEVNADLSRPEGRAAAVAAIERAGAPALDGLVACAGLGPHVADHVTIVSVNYFGAQVLLDALRPALSRGTEPAAVAISSNRCCRWRAPASAGADPSLRPAAPSAARRITSDLPGAGDLSPSVPGTPRRTA